MLTHTFAVSFIVATVGAAASQVVALVGRLESDANTAKTFTRTPEGDWRTMVTGPDGVTRPYVYVPGSKVSPTIRVELELAASQRVPVVTYRYTIRNESTARQTLSRVLLPTLGPVEVRTLPPDWEILPKQIPGGSAFAGRQVDGVPIGVPPGGVVEGLAFETPVLPGVITARTLGNVPLKDDVPPGLTAEQQEDLRRLAPGFVERRIIGPAIATGRGEPELGFDVLLARVAMRYTTELKMVAHPDAVLVDQTFAAIARAGATLDAPDVRDGLTKLRALRADRFTNPWHRELSQALSICADALLSGHLPIRN
jgi:hypothetical protein